MCSTHHGGLRRLCFISYLVRYRYGFNFKGIYSIYGSRETTVPSYTTVLTTSILCLVSTRRGSASFRVMRVSFTESARSDFCFCRSACCNLWLIFLTKRELRNQCSGSISLSIGSVVDRYRYAAAPNKNFLADADPDPDPDWHKNNVDPHADRYKCQAYEKYRSV